MNSEQAQQAKKKGPAELSKWLRSEDCFWELVESLEKCAPPDHSHFLSPDEVCYLGLLRLREELRFSVLTDLNGGIAKALRVLEHPRILEILARAVEEEDFQATPHYIRFTISLVTSCMDACTRHQRSHI
jgi:hypothetical protein